MSAVYLSVCLSVACLDITRERKGLGSPSLMEAGWKPIARYTGERSKVKVTRPINAYSAISSEREGLKTARRPAWQASAVTSKVKGQMSRSPGRLTLRSEVRHKVRRESIQTWNLVHLWSITDKRRDLQIQRSLFARSRDASDSDAGVGRYVQKETSATYQNKMTKNTNTETLSPGESTI